MAHDVFVSYANEDKATADALVATLEQQQIRCWIAPRDVLPGQEYADALVEAIGDAQVMVLVFSAKANDSPHVMREVERAASKGIAILPLRIEDVAPSRSMEYFISGTHWLDALTPPLEKHLQHLAETVRLLLARVGTAAPVEGEPKGDAPAPTTRTAVNAGMGRPPPWQGMLEAARRRGGSRMAFLALGAGAIAVVAIVIVVAVLSRDGGGDGDGSGPIVEGSPTATVTPTITPQPTTTPQLTLADAPYYLDVGDVLPGFKQVDPYEQGLSKEDLPSNAAEPAMYLSEDPLQIVLLVLQVAEGDVLKAVVYDQLTDNTYLEDELSPYSGGAEILWSDPAVGDAARRARFTAPFGNAAANFEVIIFLQEKGADAAVIWAFNIWREESPIIDNAEIVREISARISSSPPTPTPPPQSSTTIPDDSRAGITVRRDELQPGDCYDPGPLGITTPVDLIDCAVPGRTQVLKVIELAGSYPGGSEFNREGQASCPINYDRSESYLPAVWDWEAGFKLIICVQ